MWLHTPPSSLSQWEFVTFCVMDSGSTSTDVPNGPNSRSGTQNSENLTEAYLGTSSFVSTFWNYFSVLNNSISFWKNVMVQVFEFWRCNRFRGQNLTLKTFNHIFVLNSSNTRAYHSLQALHRGHVVGASFCVCWFPVVNAAPIAASPTRALPSSSSWQRANKRTAARASVCAHAMRARQSCAPVRQPMIACIEK